MKMSFIMRGIPGSGKSTVAKLLASSTESVIHAVDDLHTDEAGVFFWDERLEKQRYDENLANFNMLIEFRKDFDENACD